MAITRTPKLFHEAPHGKGGRLYLLVVRSNDEDLPRLQLGLALVEPVGRKHLAARPPDRERSKPRVHHVVTLAARAQDPGRVLSYRCLGDVPGGVERRQFRLAHRLAPDRAMEAWYYPSIG
jgi:hypothetical protein